ncbi:MAG: aminoglycoside phosphotransferase family protein [Fimbriimonadaceae bacterium]
MLPSQIQAFAKASNFTPTEELPPGYCSRIFTNGPLILKFPFQGEEQTSGAFAAIKLQSIGGPKIYAHHEPTGSLIMERILGNQNLNTNCYTLSPHFPKESDGTPSDEPPFIDLALKLRTLNTTNCLSLESYYQNPPEIAQKLLKTPHEKVFLHGDLHHENILFDPKTNLYRPIDPKGLVGDPAFECVAFLRNPINTIPTHPDLYNFTKNRINRLSTALKLDPYRIAAWLYIDRFCDLQEDPKNERWQNIQPVFEQILEHFQVN